MSGNLLYLSGLALSLTGFCTAAAIPCFVLSTGLNLASLLIRIIRDDNHSLSSTLGIDVGSASGVAVLVALTSLLGITTCISGVGSVIFNNMSLFGVAHAAAPFFVATATIYANYFVQGVNEILFNTSQRSDLDNRISRINLNNVASDSDGIQNTGNNNRQQIHQLGGRRVNNENNLQFI